MLNLHKKWIKDGGKLNASNSNFRSGTIIGGGRPGFEEEIQSSSLPAFKQLLHMLTNWREEILNYFEYRITNGFDEGKNNRIKTINRLAYGYCNTDNSRIRIFATNSSFEERISHLLT